MKRLPLHGIRLLDLTVVWAGPYGSMFLGDVGAEVVRVESITHQDPMTRGNVTIPASLLNSPRGAYYVDREPGERPYNRYGFFSFSARHKYSMTVDLTKAEGREIAMRLVSVSDAIIDNNRASTLHKLGLSYEDVRKVRPDIVYLQAPAYGTTGPYVNYKGFGANTEAIVGHTWLRGYPDADPSMTYIVFHSDAAAGASAAFALTSALDYRRRTGKGQFIDMSQAENMAPHLSQAFMDYSMNKRSQISLGNRHPSMSPQGAYKAKGTDQWVAISIESDMQWVAFCRVIGQPALAEDIRYKTVIARRRNHDELDKIIGEWTKERDGYQIMNTLQKAGVIAAPVVTYPQVHYDPHLIERGLFELVAEPEAGVHLHPGRGFRYSETPLDIRTPSPNLGEHNDYLYKHILGYSDGEIQRFTKEHHIGDTYIETPLEAGA